jgi:hypothetical protein
MKTLVWKTILIVLIVLVTVGLSLAYGFMLSHLYGDDLAALMDLGIIPGLGAALCLYGSMFCFGCGMGSLSNALIQKLTESIRK